MINKNFPAFIAGPIAGTVLWLVLSGCAPSAPSTTTTTQVTTPAPAPAPEPVAVAQDDYDYYPGYEVYYSRNRHEYVYRDGNSWVRRPQPRGITVDVLRAAPSVRVDFHDAPERHHDTVVHSYPRNWRRPDNQDDRKDGHR